MKKSLPSIVTVIACVLISCNPQMIPAGVSTNPTIETWRCGLIQENIDELDISGAWTAEYNEYSTESLFIYDDGEYTQLRANTSTNQN